MELLISTKDFLLQQQSSSHSLKSYPDLILKIQPYLQDLISSSSRQEVILRPLVSSGSPNSLGTSRNMHDSSFFKEKYGFEL